MDCILMPQNLRPGVIFPNRNARALRAILRRKEVLLCVRILVHGKWHWSKIRCGKCSVWFVRIWQIEIYSHVKDSVVSTSQGSSSLYGSVVFCFVCLAVCLFGWVGGLVGWFVGWLICLVRFFLVLFWFGLV